MKGLKRIRLAAGLTQAALAKALGVTQSNVSMWETGQAWPEGAMIEALADCLGCSIDDLFGRETPERTSA